MRLIVCSQIKMGGLFGHREAPYLTNMQGLFFKDFNNSYIPNILLELYLEKVYDPYLGGKRDLTILDLGANIGLFSFYASQYAKKIIAVEPSAFHQETLQHMLKYNKLDQKVTPVQAAISNTDGEAEFHHNNNVTMFSLSGAVEDNSMEVEKVRKITLETLLKEQKIEHVDFMKLDIEGEEFNVLASESFRKVAPMIDALVVELHSWAGVNYSQAWACLRDAGYEVVQIPAVATILGARRK